MAFASDAHRQWSQLPPAILRKICTKITDIVDYIQFRSACRSWRSAAKPSDLPPQLPLLLLPHDTDASSDISFFDLSGYGDPLRSLYDLSLGKISTFSSPEIRNKIVCGSSFGWLALSDPLYSSLSLWNPFTRARIDLPPPSNLPPSVDPNRSSLKEMRNKFSSAVDPVRLLEAIRRNLPSSFDPHLSISSMKVSTGRSLEVEAIPWKVSLSSNPLVKGCSVVIVMERSTKFAVCMIGSQQWSLYEISPFTPASMVFHERKLYAFDARTRGVLAGRYCSPESFPSVKIPAPIDNEYFNVSAFYTVETDGELLMVVHYLVSIGEGTNWVKVFKLVSDGEDLKWEPITNLGDRAIFVSQNNSSMVCARDFDGCEEDCIYFSELCCSPREDLKEGVYYIEVYSLKDCRFRPLSCRWICKGGGNAAWLVPSLF